MEAIDQQTTSMEPIESQAQEEELETHEHEPPTRETELATEMLRAQGEQNSLTTSPRINGNEQLEQLLRAQGEQKLLTTPPRTANDSEPLDFVTHHSYTVEFKLAVLDWYHKNGENKNRAAREFNIDRKRVREWELNEEWLRVQPDRSKKRGKASADSPGPGRPPLSRDLDLALVTWFLEQKDQKKIVFNKHIKAKALELAPIYGLPDSFRASEMWVLGWKKRNYNKIDYELPKKILPVSTLVTEAMMPAPDFEEHLRELQRAGDQLGEGADAITSVADALQVNCMGGPPGSEFNGESSNNSMQMEINPMAVQQHLQQATAKAQRNLLAIGKKRPQQQMSSPAKDSVTLQERLREQEQQIKLLETTVLALEREFTGKASQVKHLLQQLKASVTDTRIQLEVSPLVVNLRTASSSAKGPGRPAKKPKRM